MENQINWLRDFQETSEDIMQDVVLLEAMLLRREHVGPGILDLSPELSEKAFYRLFDYLAQHTFDLHTLNLRLREG